MASKASDDPITPEPFWFLDPQLHRLASVELRFVTQWMDHEKPAQDWIREELAHGWLPWWADIEVKELDDIRTVVRANRMTFVGSVRRWLFQNNRDYPPIEWATSSSIYIGPSILVGRDPDGFEFPVYDSRGRVHIDIQRIRFHHGFTVRRLCQQGFMPWPEEPPTEPLKEGTKSDETESNETKDEVPDDAEPRHVKYGMPEPRSSEQKAIQAFVIKTYGSKWRAVTLGTIMDAACKDAEFRKLVFPFPERSTWRRALGLKKD
jgi:hypothetical protein